MSYSPLKVCIFGAGGIGSYLAAKLAIAGSCEVSAIGRGYHIDAIKRNGLRLITTDETEHIHTIKAVTRADALPLQDVIIASVKATSLPAIADDIAGLLAPGGVVVFANNGIPWWWNFGNEEGEGHLWRVDPEGALWKRLGAEKVLGCVLYSANSITEAGTVTHLGNNRWILGEPGNVVSERLSRVAALFEAAGLNVEVSSDIREQIWNKLLRNAAFNSLCALTRLSAHDFGDFPDLVALAQSMMDEVRHVAAAKGWNLPEAKAIDIVNSGGLINGQKPQGKVYPSMLQDVLMGRPMEIDAILGQVQTFAHEEGILVPRIDLVLAILTGLNRSLSAPNHVPIDKTLLPQFA